MDKATQQFILDHAGDNPARLMLQSSRFPGIDMPFVIRQIAARQRIKAKIPTFYEHPDLEYPRQLSVEQSSSEQTALHKAKLVSGTSLVDLTGGLGVDFYFMAQHFNDSIYVERQEELCELAAINFKILQLKNYSIRNADATDYIHQLTEADVIYLDPHRRDKLGRKAVQISDCEPDLTKLSSLLTSKAKTVIVKLSPMLDLHRALLDLKETIQVDILSVDNECKEIVLLLRKEDAVTTPLIRCFNYLKNGEVQLFSYTGLEDTELNTYTDSPSGYLYEPNPSIMKSGAYNRIADQFELKKFHPNTHLYSSEHYHDEFPGRVFKISENIEFSKSAVRQLRDSYPTANISVRNFPLSVDELRKRTKIKDGGNWYMFASTVGSTKHLLTLCTKTERKL
jgi:16S rRNA G966 N2-methylase RsmD